MIKPNFKYLNQLANLLDKAHIRYQRQKKGNGPKYGYWQDSYVHACGTPACALGHWVEANPKRWAWRSDGFDDHGERNDLYRFPVYIGPHPINDETEIDMFRGAQIDFGLTGDDVSQLFSSWGCGRAETAKEAANYIRDFIVDKGGKVDKRLAVPQPKRKAKTKAKTKRKA